MWTAEKKFDYSPTSSTYQKNTEKILKLWNVELQMIIYVIIVYILINVLISKTFFITFPS